MSKPNRRTRRRDQDVEAGMVFAWRVPGGSFGRMMIGVLVASGLFAGAASMVRVKGPKRTVESRESARVVVLSPGDPASRELVDWARFHSPFPDRWEPVAEGRLTAMMAEVTAGLEKQGAYESRLRPRLVEPEEPDLPGLNGDGAFVLTAPGHPEGREDTVAETLPVKAISEAVDGLAGRWGRRSADWERDNAAELMGSEARFMVALTPEGRVEMCLLVHKSKALSKEANVEMERWLRGQKAAPDPEADGLVWGMVRIRLEPTVEQEARDD